MRAARVQQLRDLFLISHAIELRLYRVRRCRHLTECESRREDFDEDGFHRSWPLAMPFASRERVLCCWPMVPMTIGASIPSNDPLAFWPSPAYLPIAPASAVWSRPPSSDESICDPFSMSEDRPAAAIVLAKLPRVPLCCLTASTSLF